MQYILRSVRNNDHRLSMVSIDSLIHNSANKPTCIHKYKFKLLLWWPMQRSFEISFSLLIKIIFHSLLTAKYFLSAYRIHKIQFIELFKLWRIYVWKSIAGIYILSQLNCGKNFNGLWSVCCTGSNKTVWLLTFAIIIKIIGPNYARKCWEFTKYGLFTPLFPLLSLFLIHLPLMMWIHHSNGRKKKLPTHYK